MSADSYEFINRFRQLKQLEEKKKKSNKALPAELEISASTSDFEEDSNEETVSKVISLLT